MTRVPAAPSIAGLPPWPPEFVARYVAEGHWSGRTLFDAVYRADPAATAVVDGAHRLTYAELLSRADGAAGRLLALGLRPDDRIVVQLTNGWPFVVLTLACLRIGVVPVMALPAHGRHELTFIAQHAEARAVVVPGGGKYAGHLDIARDVAAAAPTVEHVFVDDVQGLRELCAPAAEPLDAAAPSSRDIALMLLSGGTTGLPKLIARAHDDYGCYVRRFGEVNRLGASSAFLAVLPMGHSLPFGLTLATLQHGGTVVIGGSPAPAKAFAVIEAERVTHTALVPAIAQSWLSYRTTEAGHDLSSMRLLLVGGARLPDEIADRFVPALTAALQQGYGMAEGLVCLTDPDDPADVVEHTQGRPITSADELRLVDEDGRALTDGTPGELLTRGPCTPRGYYRADEHNERAFVDGWLRTGDIVRIRPDGNIVVEGRQKDMINRGGEKVSAEEVENFAYQLPGVRLAAAVAMPDPELGERVCLYVTAAAQVALDDVVAVMDRAGAARYKLPERLVVLDTLPVTNVGKIDKKALRADIAARLELELDTSATLAR
ncbi:(2,3-dihydroxybenzoyl)adenylate synthase [Dactylosporangium sp. CS-033363]|uniref:(2,3-dihydroxybenzoyl)adenylate synthase n=1 Tax=Dactylosporangium sp. CS-033363 TaxID=3239935 RepID=UPI003D8F2AB9